MIDLSTHPEDAPRIYQEVARSLSGRSVTVLFGDPGVEGLEGIIHWDDPENATITIRPDLGDQVTYEAFLHECAHAMIDWPPPGSKFLDKDESDAIIRAVYDIDQDYWARVRKALWEEKITPRENAVKGLSAKLQQVVLSALGPVASYQARLEWLRDHVKFVKNPPSKAEEESDE